MAFDVTFMGGPRPTGDGSPVQPQLDRQAAVVIADGHPRFYQPNYRATVGDSSGLFIATTAIAGVAPGTALSATPPMCIWNPANSGKNLYIVRTSVGYVSGTLGAGSLWYAQVANQQTKPTTGTVLTPVCCALGNGSTATGQAFQGSTLIAVPTALGPAPFTFGAFLATTAGFGPMMVDELAAAFLVVPGTAFVIQGVAVAGTSPLVAMSVQWGEERI